MTNAMIPYPLLTGVPRTGQTSVYQAGDDGTYQAGHPGARFADLGNGTVLDRHLYSTPTMWVKTPHLMIPGPVGVAAENTIQVARGVWSNAVDYVAGDLVQGDGDPNDLFYVCILANGPGGVGAQEPPNATYWVQTIWTSSAANLITPQTKNWTTAITDCEALDYAGYTDWRVPNWMEIVSLYNTEDGTSPSWYPPFAIVSSSFWSSSTKQATNTNAFRVIASTSLSMTSYAKANTQAVLPIRGGITNG